MKPKVLFILHTPPPVHGAAMMGSYIKNSKLINNIFDTKYIRLGTTSSFKERGKTNFKKILRFIYLFWITFITALKFRPDITYMSLTSSGAGFYKDALVVSLLKFTGTKLVYHFHNRGVKTRQDKPFSNWLYKKVFKNADVILLSKHLYTDVEKYVPKERVYICPNGIPDSFNNLEIQNGLTDKETTHFLFLSNLLKTKGVFVLLKACKLLKEKGWSFRCKLVGGEADITASDLLQKISELGLEEEVQYIGKKYDTEKKEVFAKSDVFVFPTYYETFGLVNLEAMQAGLPVISTPEGGIPDVIKDGETGFLVPQNDSKALAEKLEDLIKNPKLRREMGEAGRKRYEEKFTVKHFEERMVDILTELTSNDDKN